ncbi:hypothetical protein BDZ91DRAFT_764481 [Kalaharituber pfeilii]|nr:hypothetical protein BDZ91DRAFT_764481 [Kalaharituber pfeilii]
MRVRFCVERGGGGEGGGAGPTGWRKERRVRWGSWEGQLWGNRRVVGAALVGSCGGSCFAARASRRCCVLAVLYCPVLRLRPSDQALRMCVWRAGGAAGQLGRAPPERASKQAGKASRQARKQLRQLRRLENRDDALECDRQCLGCDNAGSTRRAGRSGVQAMPAAAAAEASAAGARTF